MKGDHHLVFNLIVFFAFCVNHFNFAQKQPSPLRLDLNLPTIVGELDQCLTRINRRLAARQNELNAIILKLQKLWTIDKAANITAPVVIKGLLVSDQLISKKISLPIASVFMPQLNGPTIYKLINEKSLYLSSIPDKVEREYALRSKSNQTIRGSIIFKASVKLAKASFDQLYVQSNLNSVPVDYVANKVLRKSGHQIIDGSWTFQTAIKANWLNVTDRLAGVLMADILLPQTSSYQEVNGRLTVSRAYFTHLSVDRLNGIQIGDYIQKYSPISQTIVGQKHIKSIKVDNVTVSGLVNEKNLTNIIAKSIPIDRPIKMQNNLMFTRAINVNHLKVKQIKHNQHQAIDVDYVLMEGVTPNGNNVITGKKLFNSLNAASITVRSTFNGLKVPHDLVPLNQPVAVTSNVKFLAPIIIANRLNVRTINRINPNQDLVLRNTPEIQQISGEKQFIHGISVNQSVNIGEEGRVNQLTGRQLERHLRRQINYASNRDDYVYNGLEINGNLDANWVNGRRINDLPFILLSRSKNQTIENAINMVKTLKAGKVTVARMNNHDFPGDLVLINSNKPQIITGKKTFTTIISNNSIYLTPKAYLNTYDERYIRSIIAHNRNNDKALWISGHKRFNTLTVNGNIITGQKLINGINMSNILVRDQMQLITGYKTFLGPVKVRDRLDAYDARVTILNNYRIADLKL